MQVSESQWRILEILSKGDQTPTGLAGKLGISLPATLHNLKGLERENLIRKVAGKQGKTRPYTSYSVGSGFVYFMKVIKGEAGRGMVEADAGVRRQLRLWSIPQRALREPIERYWWRLRESRMFSRVRGMAVCGAAAEGTLRSEEKIEVTIVGDLKRGELKGIERAEIGGIAFSTTFLKDARRLKRPARLIYDSTGALEKVLAQKEVSKK